MEFILDKDEVNKRIHQPPALVELFSLGLVIGVVGIFIYLAPQISYAYFDYQNYLNAARGDFSFFYYGYWIIPIFTLLAKLPLNLGYATWCILNILGVFLAARVFRGKVSMVLLSFQMFYSLILGQISGIIVGSLALCWWGIVNKKWFIAGIGIALASSKYQMGLVGCLILLIGSGISWKESLRILILPCLVWAGSLILYPGWPLDVYQLLQNNPPNDQGSISLWRWVGAWALLLWVPPLVMHLSPQRRFLALVAASALALPYYQSNDLLWLLVLPIGWVGLLGNLGYLLGVVGWTILQLLAILPIIVYLAALVPVVNKILKIPGLAIPATTEKINLP